MVDLSPERVLDCYRTMWLIRIFEETASELYREGSLPGFIHLSIGQEACAVGACAALEAEDYITSTHRGHGHTLAKGGDAGRMMAELFGKRQGYSKGRGGSMHIADVSAGILGANGIVGQSMSLAIGAALTSQVREEGRVVVAFFGEGASGAGVAHEAMNIAGLWKLPVIFFCEANRYAELSPYDIHVPIERISDRARGYGFEGTTVDGGDLLAVIEAVSVAVDHARAGEGPSLIEAKTSRWHGHYEGDPQTYKSAVEVSGEDNIDPIVRFAPYVLEKGASQVELDAAETWAREQIFNAVQFANTADEPNYESLLEDVYSSTAS